jgi:hypothetical protein
MGLIDPTIMTVFSNRGSDSPEFLAGLEKERKELTGLLFATQAREKLSFVPLAEDVSKTFLETQFMGYGSKMRVFYYGGHADTLSLDLATGDAFSVDAFAENIKNCPALKLVFLNGCSTKGFVKRIFERSASQGAQIQAVIANSFPVNDQEARLFAVRFFRRLVDGLPLEAAFRTAIIDFPQYARRDKNIYRMGIDKKTMDVNDIRLVEPAEVAGEPRRASVSENQLLAGDKESAPWGLYISNEKILDWTLYEVKKETSVEIGDLETKIKLKANDIMKMDAELDEFDDPADLPVKLAAKKAKLIADKATAEADLDGLRDDLGRLKKESIDEQVIRIFAENFYDLNYLVQTDYVSTMAPQEAKMAGFILHGSTFCGINWLSYRAVDSLKLPVQEIDKVRFDYSATLQTGDIWAQAAAQLQIDETTPEEIVKAIHRQYRSADGQTQKGFLFLFRSMPRTAAFQKFTKIALEFWDLFVRLFRELDGGREFDHRVCLFILDENCAWATQKESMYINDRYDTYNSLIGATGECNKSVWVLPVVEPLTKNAIMKWQQACKSFDLRLTLKPFEWENAINTAEGGKLILAIQFISGVKVNNVLRKPEAFLRFKAKYLDNPL